tara:strand:+ start:171 stop:422 length:252 start_codon:yes stop_codon:yes gene_type:complete
MKQINLKLPDNLLKAANKYVDKFGFRNIQELATESIREKVFEKSEYDETFSEKEIALIDALIEKTLKNKEFGTRKELMEALER